MKDLKKTIGDFWSKKATIPNNQIKVNWWQCPLIVKHINRIVCGSDVHGFSQGLIELAQSLPEVNLPFNKGISVGGGNGTKEMNLLRQGIVNVFEIYEYSEARIKLGIETAKRQSLENRISFIHGNAFELADKNEQYDFVHWNNSLHHMLDVNQAVEWSKNVLRPGGVFFMDDFIGASRFQWPDEQLEIATRIRKVFENSKYFNAPQANSKALSTTITRPDKDKMIEIDPSEAADSANIVDAIYKHFPNVEFRVTGGVIYSLALRDMLKNFDEKDDKIILDLLMIIDELYAKLGQTHYGVALAIKEGNAATYKRNL